VKKQASEELQQAASMKKKKDLRSKTAAVTALSRPQKGALERRSQTMAKSPTLHSDGGDSLDHARAMPAKRKDDSGSSSSSSLTVTEVVAHAEVAAQGKVAAEEAPDSPVSNKSKNADDFGSANWYPKGGTGCDANRGYYNNNFSGSGGYNNYGGGKYKQNYGKHAASKARTEDWGRDRTDMTTPSARSASESPIGGKAHTTQRTSMADHATAFAAHWFGAARFAPDGARRSKVGRSSTLSDNFYIAQYSSGGTGVKSPDDKHKVKKPPLQTSKTGKSKTMMWDEESDDDYIEVVMNHMQPTKLHKHDDRWKRAGDKHTNPAAKCCAIMHAYLDVDNDGKISLDDLMSARTSKMCAEEFQRQHYPIFCGIWLLITVGLWSYFSYKMGGDMWKNPAGLDNIWPRMTDMRLDTDCYDYRGEVWRLITYQFSHGNALHIGSNSLLLVSLGFPLEGFHGALRTFLIFNLGVVGGALCFTVSSPHVPMVGMSGGCYSLLGMQMAGLLMNWRQTQYRRPSLVLMLGLAAFDVGGVVLGRAIIPGAPVSSSSVAHAAHFGGYVAGFCAGVIGGRILVPTDCSRGLQASIVMISVFLVAFCVLWATLWPPRSIWSMDPWCWTRAIYAPNVTEFGLGFRCVQCWSLECVQRWSDIAEKIISPSMEQCDRFGMAFSEPI